EAVFRAMIAHVDPITLIRGNVIGDTLPLVYPTILGIWSRLAGESEVSLRLLSAFSAMLALPAYYHLGRLMFGQRAGTIALALGALSPMAISYAQEVRFYAQSIFFGVWLAVGLVAIVRGKRYGFPLYLFAAIGGLYTHYFTGVMLVAAHLWLLLYPPARAKW